MPEYLQAVIGLPIGYVLGLCGWFVFLWIEDL